MPKRIKVELRSLRKSIKERIKIVEDGIAAGETAVRSARASKDAPRQKANTATLAQARRMVKALKRIEQAVADECCSQVQNCDFIFQ